MLFLLSPAKTLDFDTPAHVETASRPVFMKEAAQLIEALRQKSATEVAGLMKLSDKLAALNVARYGTWTSRASARNSKQAALAFNGDVYEGLQANRLSAQDLGWAQDHVVILSGLYGTLKPLDRLQPYRLEMGTRLATSLGKDLYAFWGDRIARQLNKQVLGHVHPVVVNLASEEYFKAVDRHTLKPRVVHCVFEDWHDGRYKIIGFHAKRARGLMARHAITRRAESPDDLLDFRAEGYAYARSASEADRLVFRRRT